MVMSVRKIQELMDDDSIPPITAAQADSVNVLMTSPPGHRSQPPTPPSLERQIMNGLDEHGRYSEDVPSSDGHRIALLRKTAIAICRDYGWGYTASTTPIESGLTRVEVALDL